MCSSGCNFLLRSIQSVCRQRVRRSSNYADPERRAYTLHNDEEDSRSRPRVDLSVNAVMRSPNFLRPNTTWGPSGRRRHRGQMDVWIGEVQKTTMIGGRPQKQSLAQISNERLVAADR
jgi:hypothetical protein